MWHDQEEWVGCRRCCFWDTGKNRVQIPLFYIVFSIVISCITLLPDIQLQWDLHPNEAFWSYEKVMKENRNWNVRQVIHFGLISLDHVTYHDGDIWKWHQAIGYKIFESKLIKMGVGEGVIPWIIRSKTVNRFIWCLVSRIEQKCQRSTKILVHGLFMGQIWFQGYRTKYVKGQPTWWR